MGRQKSRPAAPMIFSSLRIMGLITKQDEVESGKSMGRLKARSDAPMIWGFVSKIRGSFLIFDPIVR